MINIKLLRLAANKAGIIPVAALGGVKERRVILLPAAVLHPTVSAVSLSFAELRQRRAAHRDMTVCLGFIGQEAFKIRIARYSLLALNAKGKPGEFISSLIHR